MAFTRSKYESDFNGIINVEMSEEESAVAGTEPTAAAVSPLTAYVSGSRKRNGIHVRGAVLKRTITDGTDSCSVSSFIALRSVADATDAQYQPGQTVTVGGMAWTISSLRKELQK